MANDEERIDFVVTWVDGSDPAWRAEFDRYRTGSAGTASGNACPTGSEDASAERYRDMGTLRYLLRGIERFAPWAGTVHLVTWGHLPQWLDTSSAGIHIVRHSDFIPPEYLPTFNSCTIELNMHRMEGLSRRFVYFNDDFLLCRPVGPERFFRNGLPCDEARLSIIRAERTGHNALECMRIINRRYDKRTSIRRNPGKWLNPRYPLADLAKTMLLMPWSFFPGFREFHMAQPFLRDTFETLWREEGDELDATCRNRFRQATDLSQWLARYEQLASGRFHPIAIRDTLLATLSEENMAGIRDAMASGRYTMACLNDDNSIKFPASVRAAIEETLERLLPGKSRYEL